MGPKLLLTETFPDTLSLHRKPQKEGQWSSCPKGDGNRHTGTAVFQALAFDDYK